MEVLLEAQARIINSIEQILANWKKEGERKTPEAAQRRLERLEALWTEFQAIHDQLITSEDKSHEYFQQNKYQQAYNYYQSVCKFIANYESEPLLKPATFVFNPKVQQKTKSSILDDSNEKYEREFDHYEKQYNKIKKQINTKMWSVSHKEKSTPQMEIPTFGGSYQHWISFKDLFTEAIHTNASLSNAQKMQFLKGKVKGEAEKLIQHLTISFDNYQTCWDILNHRYNNKKLIFTSHINTLLNLPTMQYQSAASIKKIHDTANECLHAIKNLGVDTSSWDPILVHLITQKLDADSHNDYLESLKAPRELPILSELLEYLESKFTSLESSRRKLEAPKSAQQHHDYKKLQYNKFNHTSSSKPFINHVNTKTLQSTSRKCPLCNEFHGLFHCKNFLEMRPEVRRKTVNKLNICENCLYSHGNKECISEKRCQQPHCNARHNSLLHDAYVVSYNSRGASTSNETNLQRRHVTNVTQDNIKEEHLATALIKVLSADGSYVTMRALIDPGSQQSLISEKQLNALVCRARTAVESFLGSAPRKTNVEVP
ncbi:hypothetical protein NE865_05508 [Phthorimaea operculella]|nr:hypothetical protein NE865_05508 [Phthorimaea operculella]